MNNNHIQQILEELYQIDPSFRAHEDKLKSMLSEILAAKPDVQIDEQFRNRLRSQLLHRAAELQAPAMSTSIFNRMFQVPAMRFAMGGALILLIALTAMQSGGSLRVAPGQEIDKVNSQAFGPLAQNTTEGGAPISAAFGGRGGGGGGGMGGDATVASEKMIAPYPGDYTSYRYVYKGEDFELPASVGVLRRVQGALTGPAGSFLKNLGTIDLGTFSQARMQNVTLIEDKEFGYQINIFFDEGAVSINENWLRWNHPEANCRDEACYQALRLKPSDIPADDRVIEIANRFMEDHKISRDGYGAPEVMNEWRTAYEMMSDKSQFYIPDTVSIVYPLVIDGKFVYDDGGQKHGVYVSVNVRQMRVSSAGTITGQKYQSSEYVGVTDKKTVLDVVAKGGRYGYIDPQAKIVDIEVGTPTLAYAKIWTSKDNISSELLVPALAFPVLTPPANAQWYPKQIIVPLAQELLKQDMGGPINIMEGAYLK